MHKLHLEDHFALGEGTLPKLRLNSPADGWFPALRKLRWTIEISTLPYVDLCLSPHLKTIRIHSGFVDKTKTPRDFPRTVASTISTLPTSTLRSLHVDISHMPWAYLKHSLPSLVLRCGSSLTKFACPTTLSDAAINHLAHLPNLRYWNTTDPPLNYSNSPLPLPLTFPPLTQFYVAGDAGFSWISLFGRLATGVPGVQALTRIRESLKELCVGNFDSDPIIDVSFVSPIQMFHNLTFLNVVTGCPNNRCAFELDDHNVAELTAALPCLAALYLGFPCSRNTCATTITCLLWISVRCLELEDLVIHFNTANIVEDFKRVSTDLRFERPRSLPRCPLQILEVFETPLTLDEPSLEIVANGMVDTFPSLGCCKGSEEWQDLSKRIKELQKLT